MELAQFLLAKHNRFVQLMRDRIKMLLLKNQQLQLSHHHSSLMLFLFLFQNIRLRLDGLRALIGGRISRSE